MKIVIVGGGTAGWLTALFISKVKPEHEVTVIESKKIGIIGVGESSTGALVDVLTNWLWAFDCDIMEFFRETGATLKYGIKHKGWTNQIDDFYYGPIDGTETATAMPDGLFCKGISHHGQNMHRTTLYGNMMEKLISPISKTSNRFELNTHALHFDTTLLGDYFKKIVCKNNKVKLIDKEIINVNLKENGFIKGVTLVDGSNIEGDFFVDASGFSRTLIRQLNPSWVSYKNNLPVNSAIPFVLDYKEDETPEPWTTAWAHKAGWVWQIPLQHRKGCGYVFSDEFTTADAALDELQQTFNGQVEPIKLLKFETGRLQHIWQKNCLAIGLCAGFAEPLESTSVHSTITQLLNFTFEYLRPTLEETVNEGSINIYNQRTARMYDDFKEFLVAHYLGGRNDSEFWKYISADGTITDFTRHIREMSKSKLPSFNDFNQYPGAAGWHLWSFVLQGTGQIKIKDPFLHLHPFVIQDCTNKEFDLVSTVNKMERDFYSYKEFTNVINNPNTGYRNFGP